MNNPFQQASSHWVKYSEYVIKESADGTRYVKPSLQARPSVYKPLKDAETLVVDALNVGMAQVGDSKKDESGIQSALMEFLRKYGLLGFITALPTTPNFMEYDAVYLPKNHFVKVESMSVEEYNALFYPFKKPDFKRKDKDEMQFSVSGDRDMLALAMTFRNEPLAMNMSFQREYAERYDWLLWQFKDWAFTFLSSMLYYEDFEKLDEPTKNLYRRGMSAFGGIAPTYHIELLEKPTIVWDFYSLLLGIQTMFGFTLTDESNPLRMCRHCQKMFIAGHPNAAFCSPQCKNQHNVYKSRAKSKG